MSLTCKDLCKRCQEEAMSGLGGGVNQKRVDNCDGSCCQGETHTMTKQERAVRRRERSYSQRLDTMVKSLIGSIIERHEYTQHIVFE